MVVGLFLAAVAADQIELLKQLTRYLDQHADGYRALTIIMSVVGWMILISVFAHGLWRQGKPMTEEDAQGFMARGRGGFGFRAFRGRVVGREFRVSVPFRAVKSAFRSGAWWRVVADCARSRGPRIGGLWYVRLLFRSWSAIGESDMRRGIALRLGAQRMGLLEGMRAPAC
jgi:hypothetical protein